MRTPRHGLSIGVFVLLLLGPAWGDEPAAPKWTLKGSRIIACCCAPPCPCRINKPPFHCHGCDYTTAVHVDEGTLGATDMAGVSWVVTGRGFGERVEANWAYVYVSDNATDAQMEALKGMFDDMARTAGDKAPYLIGKLLGMRKVAVAYTVSEDRRQYDCVIDGILELRTKAIVLPGRDAPAMSTGIFDDFGDRFVHADTVVHTYGDKETGYSWNLKDRQSNQADFTLTSEQVASRGIGWACWSAHAALGSKDTYGEQETGDDPK